MIGGPARALEGGCDVAALDLEGTWTWSDTADDRMVGEDRPRQCT
jgi:hypothetical protein